MGTDRELLEAAAKAAGIELEWFEVEVGDPDCDPGWYCDIKGTRRYWNPLTDDGDALRLAEKKRQHIVFTDKTVQVWESEDAPRALAVEWLHPDPYAATRRAIVRAAAEIGRSMK
jgi:hypothetical protein